MVYIPFLKIDIPEPRLQEVVPNTVSFVIGLLHRALDAAQQALDPDTPEQQDAYDRTMEAVLPRELKNVLAKWDAGTIKDEAKLSSEVEEACYDYYRRTIRQNVAGYSDEDTEDWADRKTFDQRSPLRDVLEAHAWWVHEQPPPPRCGSLPPGAGLAAAALQPPAPCCPGTITRRCCRAPTPPRLLLLRRRPCREAEQQRASSSRPLDLELESDEGRRDPEAFAAYQQQQAAARQAHEAAAQREAADAERRRRQRRQGLPRRLAGLTASGALGLAAGVGLTKLLRAVQKRMAQAQAGKQGAGDRAGRKAGGRAGGKAGGAQKRSAAGSKAAGGQQRRGSKPQ
jgi:hypothetical protein